MKILLLGANGQVGWELQRALSPLGQLSAFDRRQADLNDFKQLQQVIDTVRPHIIVNAAAYTAVDLAEQESAVAYKINEEAVGLLANAVRELDAWLIHYSTDYVFDGAADGKYAEYDVTNPQSVYGKSKLAGEQAIIESGCKHLIFRTSWVFASRGNNFAKTMLKLAREKDELKVVADQVGAPTSAELIADVTALALYKLQNYSAIASSCDSEPFDVSQDRLRREISEDASTSVGMTPGGAGVTESCHSERSRGISSTKEIPTSGSDASEPELKTPSFPRRRESSGQIPNDSDISGIYHLTASGETSWHGFAKFVIAYAEKSGVKLKVKSDNIEPITTAQFPRPAKRPLNSRLDTYKLQAFLGITLPDWQLHVQRMLTEYIETQP